MYPMKLKAVFKDYIWGGTKLRNSYGKDTKLDTVAESWELSCHPDGCCTVANGPAAGMELAQYIAVKGDRVVGAHPARYSYFPIMIKIIDSAQDLSVQVHPNNDYALRVEGQYGKTEFWYVMEAEPGASLICGFKRPVTKEEVRRRIADQTLDEICNRVPAHPGDTFYLPAGTIHCIGGGITLAEVQQNSNLTYRVYDHGRLGRDGKPRELNVEKALDVLNLGPAAPLPQTLPVTFFAEYDMRLLAAEDYFTVYHFRMRGRCRLKTDRSTFHALLVLDGMMEIEYKSGRDYLEKGETVFVPADYGLYTLRGYGSFLLTMVP